MCILWFSVQRAVCSPVITVIIIIIVKQVITVTTVIVIMIVKQVITVTSVIVIMIVKQVMQSPPCFSQSSDLT